MARCDFSQRFSTPRLFARRRWFVSSRLLTFLVLLAALVQVVPAGSAHANGLHCLSDASVTAELTASSHAIERWVTPPNVTAPVSRPDARVFPSSLSWIASAYCSTGLTSLSFYERLGFIAQPHRCLTTLVTMNVRLQI
ncbi:hypothetical protein Pla22_25750 [Rubripirellula amarantea]|uniref:Uncharacterized protein n=1 Tax=Rubripirellula amarantea TaxID=2527999 RepID=A0A5C5WXR7_9BACT|nr:hypothetical protein Pla22_25750 [Rubripirellula amarantea]